MFASLFYTFTQDCLVGLDLDNWIWICSGAGCVLDTSALHYHYFYDTSSGIPLSKISYLQLCVPCAFIYNVLDCPEL